MKIVNGALTAIIAATLVTGYAKQNGTTPQVQKTHTDAPGIAETASVDSQSINQLQGEPH